MTWYRVGPAGIPGSLKTDMDAVLNKKFGTSTTYAPNTWPDNVNLLGPLPEKTASGAIANITDGADGVPLKNWLVTLPASLDGYTDVNAVRTGKNLLLPHNTDIAETTLNGIKSSYSLDTQEFTFDGTNAKTDAGWLIYAINTSDFVLNGLKPGVTYRFSHNFTADFYAQITYNKSGGGIGAIGYLRGNAGRNASVSFTLPNDFDSLRQFQIGVANTATYVNITAHFQIEVGSTATAYEAYEAPTTYTASLGRTIYGGTADIVNGEGTETYPTIRIGDLTFVKDTNCQHTFRCTNLPREYGSGVYNILSSAFTTYTNGNSTGGTIASLEVGNDNTIFLNGGSATFYITADSSYDNKSASDFVSDFANTLLIYEASTPIPFTFTPITADTELGVNNFWADEGDSDVTYRADIQLALNA